MGKNAPRSGPHLYAQFVSLLVNFHKTVYQKELDKLHYQSSVDRIVILVIYCKIQPGTGQGSELSQKLFLVLANNE